MPYRELHYRWEYDLKADPEELWPFVSDTNRFNRDTGVPSVEPAKTTRERLRNARQRLRLSVYGMAVEWEEQPFEWIKPTRFGVVRSYSKGPIVELRALAELVPVLIRRGADSSIVVAGGGVITEQPLLMRAFSDAMASISPTSRVVLLREPPVIGAIALAQRALDTRNVQQAV